MVELAKQSLESQEPSQQRKSYKSGGLLSKVVAEELTSLEPAEPIIETEAAASEDDAKFNKQLQSAIHSTSIVHMLAYNLLVCSPSIFCVLYYSMQK